MNKVLCQRRCTATGYIQRWKGQQKQDKSLTICNSCKNQAIIAKETVVIQGKSKSQQHRRKPAIFPSYQLSRHETLQNN